MRSKFSKLAQAAGIALALVLILSCSSDDDKDGGNVVYGPSVPYEGKTYETVKIGNQIWMAENLNYDVAGSRCYNDVLANCAKYGRLYDWATAKIVCPAGWHLPSDAEWTTLTDFVGGESTAGKKLKTQSGWNEGGNGTDEYGFAALPSGFGYPDGGFGAVGDDGYWWSSTESNANDAYRRIIYYINGDVLRGYNLKGSLFSVRCLQD